MMGVYGDSRPQRSREKHHIECCGRPHTHIQAEYISEKRKCEQSKAFTAKYELCFPGPLSFPHLTVLKMLPMA